MDTFLADLRVALRSLLRQPGYAALAIATMAVGIGINTANYSVAEVLLFRPLLLPGLDRVVMVKGVLKNTSEITLSHSPADFRDMRESAKTLESLAALQHTQLTLTGQSEPVRLIGYRVSGDFFAALAAQPLLGRMIGAADTETGADETIVLSYGLWAAQYAGDPQIVGRKVKMNGLDYRVAGVMPREFRYPPEAQVWLPLSLSPEEAAERRRRALMLIGRLRPGVRLEQASAELDAIGSRLARDFPEIDANRGLRADPLRENISGELTARYTQLMLGATLFVLLIACANIANLQFARISVRVRELALRTALGSSRGRLLRLLLVESLLLAGVGGFVGIFVALWGMDLIKRGMSPEVQRYLPGWERISLDWHALAFTLAVSIAAGVLSGIVPAWMGSRTELAGTLKEGGRGAAGSRSRTFLRSALVVAEITVSLVLLVG